MTECGFCSGPLTKDEKNVRCENKMCPISTSGFHPANEHKKYVSRLRKALKDEKKGVFPMYQETGGYIPMERADRKGISREALEGDKNALRKIRNGFYTRDEWKAFSRREKLYFYQFVSDRLTNYGYYKKNKDPYLSKIRKHLGNNDPGEAIKMANLIIRRSGMEAGKEYTEKQLADMRKRRLGMMNPRLKEGDETRPRKAKKPEDRKDDEDSGPADKEAGRGVGGEEAPSPGSPEFIGPIPPDERREEEREEGEKEREEEAGGAGTGIIYVRVKNSSEKTAKNVSIDSDLTEDGPFIIGPKKSVKFALRIGIGEDTTITCTSSTHVSEPTERDVLLSGKRTRTVVSFVLKEPDKGKGKEDEEKEHDKRKKGIKKARMDYLHGGGGFQGVIWSIFLFIIGVIISAIMGQIWFTIAFIAFAVYTWIPPTETSVGMGKRVEKVRDSFMKRIESARTKEEEKELYEEMRNALEAEKIVGDFKISKLFTDSRQYGREFMREFFKGLGFLFLMVAFVFSAVPFAPVIGIIIGFAGYFQLGGSDYYSEGLEGPPWKKRKK